jgi:hypothetical protein
MTERLTKISIDATTGIETITELTDEEMSQVELDRAKALEEFEAEESRRSAQDALKESAKAKLVAGQPLTAEEAATIVI